MRSNLTAPDASEIKSVLESTLRRAYRRNRNSLVRCAAADDLRFDAVARLRRIARSYRAIAGFEWTVANHIATVPYWRWILRARAADIAAFAVAYPIRIANIGTTNATA